MKNLNKHILAFILLTCILAGCFINSSTNQEPNLDEFEGQVTAFKHVNLVPMTAETVLNDQTVVIGEDRILAVGATDKVPIPRDASVIDGKGAYLMPGLADMHVHIYEESRDEYPVSPLNLYIAKGVTTIRDCGTAPLGPSDTFVLDWRDEIINGEINGPMIYSSGRTIHGPVSNPGRVVRQRNEDGFDFVKLYMELSVEEFDQAQTTAEGMGMYSLGHIPYQVGFEKVLAAGLDEIAHIEELSLDLMWSDHRPSRYLSVDEWLSGMVTALLEDYGNNPQADLVFNPVDFDRVRGNDLERILRDLRKNDVAVGTTLAVGQVVNQKLFQRDEFLSREENKYLPVEFFESLLNGQDRHQLMLEMLGDNFAAWKWKGALDDYILQELHRAGVTLVSGTDSGSSSIGVVEGYSMHEELQILTENGFTPYEALQTATVNAAHVVEKMTGAGDFGTIEVGKRADLILVRSNPLQDIRNAENIIGVMARGRWYEIGELEKMIAIGD